MERLIINFIGFILVALSFLMITFSMIKSSTPEDYFIYYALIEILSSLFFSTTGVIIVGSIASFIMILVLIVAGNLFTIPAILSYLIIIGVFLFYDKKLTDYEGEITVEIENEEDKILELKEEIEQNSKKIPMLKEIISRYMKLSEFCIKIGSTFELEKIYEIIYDFLNYVFPETEIMISAKKEDPYENWVFLNKTPLLIENILKDYRFNEIRDVKFKSLIATPVFVEGKVFSIIDIRSYNYEFTPSDLRFLNYIATLSSVSISNSLIFEKTKELAIKDQLTGLYTHSYFIERLREEIATGLSRNTVFTFLMLDIDDFKKVNDTYGHQKGDVVLVRIANKLKEILREIDIIGRYGGEEFSIIIPYSHKYEGVEIAERIRREIEKEKFKFGKDELRVTVTIGVAFFPEIKTYKKLIGVADKNLYKGKKLGKNRVVV